MQSDRSIVLEVDQPGFAEARDFLAVFAELEKAPEHVHFYRVTPISIWNAAAAGLHAEPLLDGLAARSRFPVPPSLESEIRDWFRRYGLLRLERGEGALTLTSSEPDLLGELARARDVAPLVQVANGVLRVEEGNRGLLKQALIGLGYPVEDLAGYRTGEALKDLRLRERTTSGEPFALRPYQEEAARVFWAAGAAHGGSGVIVLPCGAGKTVVGMAVMDLLREETLVLTTNTVAVRQWRRELLEKTTLREEDIGEYTGERKNLRPVTIATYQILTWRRGREEPFEHFDVFGRRDWGLVIYDEVHLLPAPVFRATAELQTRRRLGLTATLLREDGREEDVFSLIGPKRYGVPWKDLESRGFIAEARCVEIRLSLSPEERQLYMSAPARTAYRIASTTPGKLNVVEDLLACHANERVLIIGQYLDQLRELSARFELPLITGRTPVGERERLYEAFRSGAIMRLVVSKVGNFAIDLPDASVAIQLSGAFGSRQEEAQRLGRILRPKSDGSAAVFYAVVTAGTKDADFAAKRQRFLAEQGYSYEIREVGEPTQDGPDGVLARGEAS